MHDMLGRKARSGFPQLLSQLLRQMLERLARPETIDRTTLPERSRDLTSAPKSSGSVTRIHTTKGPAASSAATASSLAHLPPRRGPGPSSLQTRHKSS
jgi:hypothetical protein